MTRLSNERMAELSAALRAKGRMPRRPGVLTLTRGRVDKAGPYWTIYSGQVARPAGDGLDDIDLNDPATIGVLADYARELLGVATLYVRPMIDSVATDAVFLWVIHDWRNRRYGILCRDIAEAWVSAILSAPERGES